MLPRLQAGFQYRLAQKTGRRAELLTSRRPYPTGNSTTAARLRLARGRLVESWNARDPVHKRRSFFLP